MCGIAGILGSISETNRSALKRMVDSMKHRGPDSEEYWESLPDDRGCGVMLGHRRLSILDLTSSAAQPMVDPVTDAVVNFNGEIYNYTALRDQLVANGERFQSSGDTAVMLRALGFLGHEAVRKFRGMFAFALWNARDRRLLIARDALGIKPLYLSRNPDSDGDWSVIFASELRALLASGILGKPRLNPRATASVVWNGFVVSPETAVSGIEPVWPGQLLVFNSSGQIELSEDFWSMPRNCDPALSETQLVQTLKESVRLHLLSDVPVGIFLSGGVDSAAITNLAQQVSREPVHTFTLAFEEEEYNEAIRARRIADALGTQHHEVLLTEQQFVTQLESALDSLDQPTLEGINCYHISRAVRDAGFKVALNGAGGDELFGGYNSFRNLSTLSRWLKRMHYVPSGLTHELAKMVMSVLQPTKQGLPPMTRWAKLPEIVKRGDNLISLYQLAYALFIPEFQRQLLGNTLADNAADGLPCAMRSRLLSETDARSALAAISVLEQRLFLGERILRDTDTTSMAASIELRMPLVDQVVVEHVNQLRDRERFSPLGQKSVLRRIALRGLESESFELPKKAFVLPYDRWLRRGLFKVVDPTMRDPVGITPTGLNPDAVTRLWQAFLDGAPIYWSRVWTIYVLIWWCHRHRVYL
jgi:asparagine synthase (glutamine-hydrolysing)